MLDAATRLHLDRPTSTAETADRLGLPGCDLPADSRLVTRADGGVLGFGQVFRPSPSDVRSFVRVHPQARGRGIGTALARWAVTRAGERAAELAELDEPTVRYSTTVWAGDTTGTDVMRAVGLEEFRHFLRMVTGLPAAVPPPDATADLDAYRPGHDEDALWEAYCASFSEHWGEEHPDRARFWWDVRDSPGAGYDPTLWTVTRDGSAITGFVIARVRERQQEEGYVEAIGVRPAWRSKRIGLALLAHTLRLFEARGLTAASLDVDADNVTDALRLYRSVGMTPEPNFTIWGKELG